MENSRVQVSAESMQLIVSKHFQHISTAQWSTLASGGRNPQVEQTISDMLVEMVESFTAAILRDVMTPRRPERKCWDKISVDLGDSINVGFAAALQLPVEKNEAAEKLTELVEKEVSVQLRSLLDSSSTSTSQPWPLDKMVNFTTSCLKKYLEKVQCLSPGLHTSLPSATTSLKQEKVPPAVRRCESQKADRAKISAATVVKAVNWILEKSLSETMELEGGQRDTKDSQDLQEPSSDASRSLQPSRVALASLTDDCALCLSCKRCKEHQGRVESESRSPESDEQVSVPPTTSSPSPSNHQYLAAWSSEDQGSEGDSPSATYEEMTDSDLDLLFDRLNRPPYFGPAGDETLNHMIGCEARSFAIKLTDKISFYLGYPGLGSLGSPGSPAGSPPGSPPGARSLSDSLLYDTRQRRRWCQRHHHHHEGMPPPELLWALTEDEVRRFLLKVLLWVEKSSRVGGGYMDEASVDVANDDDGDDADDGNDDVDEVVAVVAQLEEQQQNLSVRTRSLVDSSLEEELELEVEEEEDSPNNPLELCTSSSSFAASSTSSSSPNQEIQPPSPEIRSAIWHLLQALLIRLSSKTQSRRSKEPLELPPPLPPLHLDIVLGRLSERVLSEVNVPDSAVEKIHRCTRSLVRALAKDLIKEFEGKQEVLKALAAARDDLTFENAVMFHLTGCLHSLLTTTHKRSAVSRMLSVVKKLGNRT